ncbi:hypothetical protein FRB93_005710 [Tulasnella sp. JGI-2019a]|nr:hypothetical protein FRB93_005710 [Tulasnella sp. JGI-2019a]
MPPVRPIASSEPLGPLTSSVTPKKPQAPSPIEPACTSSFMSSKSTEDFTRIMPPSETVSQTAVPLSTTTGTMEAALPPLMSYARSTGVDWKDSTSPPTSGNEGPQPAAEVGDLPSSKKEPLRVGNLWYLNVHAPPPYAWVRARTKLHPTHLTLSWAPPAGGLDVITLDLQSCTEVRSVLSPSHPSARGDIGSVAARATPATSNEAGESLSEFLCPFQLIYGDGVERLGAESARERVRWVDTIWNTLSQATIVQ